MLSEQMARQRKEGRSHGKTQPVKAFCAADRPSVRDAAVGARRSLLSVASNTAGYRLSNSLGVGSRSFR